MNPLLLHDAKENDWFCAFIDNGMLKNNHMKVNAKCESFPLVLGVNLTVRHVMQVISLQCYPISVYATFSILDSMKPYGNLGMLVWKCGKHQNKHTDTHTHTYLFLSLVSFGYLEMFILLIHSAISLSILKEQDMVFSWSWILSSMSTLSGRSHWLVLRYRHDRCDIFIGWFYLKLQATLS